MTPTPVTTVGSAAQSASAQRGVPNLPSTSTAGGPVNLPVGLGALLIAAGLLLAGIKRKHMTT